MNSYYDPYERRRPARRSATDGAKPTLDDYRSLAAAYNELKSNLEAKNRELQEKERELEIKSEALQRQSKEIKNLEAELVWTHAAVQNQEEKEKPAESEDGLSWKDRYIQLQAELDNMRKRWEQRFENETRQARHQILRDMLPLADHLEMALRHADALTEESSHDFVRNIEATLRAFMDALAKYGVERIDAMGKEFDPTLHEAVGQVHVDGAEPDSIVQIVQSGYLEGGNLLRPARVLVNQPAVDG